MQNNILFLVVIIITLILSSFNILDFKKGRLKSGTLKKEFSIIEAVLLIILVIATFFISKARYQMDAIFIAVVLYLLPLIVINFKIYVSEKTKELLYSGVVFSIIIGLCMVLLITDII